MTPLINVRSYSSDQYFLDKVFYSNFYRLKKVDQKIALDIGSHAGYFCLTAMAMGYSKVYAFEPFVENYRLLLKNTEVFSSNVISNQLGISHEDKEFYINPPKINSSNFLDYSSIEESQEKQDYCVKFISLNKAAKVFVKEDFIDLLKINTGYPFDFVSNNESAFSHILNICFEMIYDKDEALFIKEKLVSLGFKDSLMVELKEKDNSFGYLGFFSKNSLNDLFEIEDLRVKNISL